jgi:hypothetical protein
MPLDADHALMPRAVPQDASGCGRTTSARRRATAEALLRHILRGPTATLAMARWCAGRGIDDGLLLARVDRTSPPCFAPGILLDAMGVVGPTRLRHRRVTLVRGGTALSDCDLWWLPDSLPAAVTLALDTTDQPFGMLVAPLRPMRRTVETRIRAAAAEHVLEIGAVVLAGGAGRRVPVAAVQERYRTALLG